MKTGVCAKCEGKNVLHIPEVRDSALGKRAVSRVLASARRSGGLLEPARFAELYVEAFVCCDCGLFEEYVAQPDRVDWQVLVDERKARRVKPRRERGG